MANLLPNLDDRRWADLVEEGRALIPFAAPLWTDHNAHDPGMMLIELFAWLAEMDIYRLNRTPAAHQLKFLDLVGVRPRPARPARTVLQITPAPDAAPMFLPRETEFDTPGPDGLGNVVFRLLSPLTAVPGRLVCLQSWDGDRFRDLRLRVQTGEPVYPFGPDPRPGAALYLGFEPGLPVDTPISLYFTPAGRDDSAGERSRQQEHARQEAEACRLPVCEDPAEQRSTAPLAIRPPAHHSVRLAWEAYVQPGKWRRLDVEPEADETLALQWSGGLTLRLPDEMKPRTVGAVEAKFAYLRCLLVSGQYDAAPYLAGVHLNAAEAEQAGFPEGAGPALDEYPDLPVEFLGRGSQRPEQIMQLSQPLPLPETVRLFTRERGLVEWQHRSDLLASGADDRHFTLDPQSGRVQFGDGEHSRAVPQEAGVWISYRHTLGRAGNMPARSRFRLSKSPGNQRFIAEFAGAQRRLVEIVNPFPAAGGDDPETFAQAAARAVQRVQSQDRAVTPADIERLALETPGIRLRRALALPNRHPAFPCYLAPGVVTVVVVPSLPAGRPAPTPELRWQVAGYLERRRVLGTRLEVVGPEYTRVTVQARVRARLGVEPSGLQRRVIQRLVDFFDPLTGGPDGHGWPFGRDVYRSEVLQVIDEVEEVDHVLELRLIAADGAESCDNICLGLVGLVESGQHQVEVEGEICLR